MKARKWMAIAALMHLTANTMAVTVGDYEISFTRGDGKSPSGYTAGWSCKSLQSAEFVEGKRVSAQGRPYDLRRTVSGPAEQSLLNTSKLGMSFQAELEGGQEAGAVLYVTQECSKSQVVPRTYYDFDKGEWKTGFATETATQKLIYRCQFSSLPGKQGQSSQTSCLVGSPSQGSSTFNWSSPLSPVGFNWGGIGQGPLDQLAWVPFNASLRLRNTREQYSQDLCQGSGKKKVVIRLSQGVEGRSGENDFRFTIQVDGGSPIVLKKRDGVLHDDILYCTDKDDVSVKVTAIEKDLFFSDRYVGDPTDTVDIPLRDRVNEGTVRLRRKRLTRTTYHDVRVTVIRQFPEGEARGQLLAERPTH